MTNSYSTVQGPSALDTTHNFNKGFKPTYYRFGLKFYRILKPNNLCHVALLNSEVIEYGDIIVAIDAPSEHNPKSKNYSLIKGRNRADFLLKYLTEIPESARNFYEIIHVESQLPHFDIDCKLTPKTQHLAADADAALLLLIDAIYQVMLEFNVPYRPDSHLRVYDSNDDTKRSYHIIVTGFSHANELEAKAFYFRVMSIIHGKYNPLVSIDPKVYCKNQAFRLIGSCKFGCNRYKKLRSDLSGKNIKCEAPLDEFYANLVSSPVGCTPLPSFLEPTAVKKHYESRTLNGYEEDAIMNIFDNWDVSIVGKYGPTHYPSAKMCTYFKLASSSPDGIISLTRIKTGKCPCHPHTATDPHTGVGAFLTIDKYGNVYFHCLSESHGKVKGLCIGQISLTNSVTDATTDDNSTIEGLDLDNEDVGFMFGDYYMPPPNKGSNTNSETIHTSSSLELTQRSAAVAINSYTSNVQLSATAAVIPSTNSNELHIINSMLGPANNNKVNGAVISRQINRQRVQAQPILNGIIPTTKTNNASSSLELTQRSAAVAINSYTSNVQLSATAAVIPPTNKDKLVLFVTNHLVQHHPGVLLVDDVLQKYKDFCAINNFQCSYENNNNGNFTKALTSINSKLLTYRKQINGKKHHEIRGFSFTSLNFMKVGFVLDGPELIGNPVQVTTDLQAIVPTLRDKINNWEEKYAGYNYRKLRGPHPLDVSNHMPDIPTITGELPQYSVVLKSPCGMGKTELIGAELEQATSFLNVSGRVSLVDKQGEDYKHIPGYKSYNTNELMKLRKIIGEKKLGITVDSVHKVIGKYQYLLLDEFTYSLDQLVRFSKKKEENVEALIERIKVTPKVIVADAFIEDTTVSILRKIRPDLIIYENNYQKHSDKTVSVVTQDKAIIYHKILTDVDNRINIMIPIGSLEDGEAFLEYLQRRSIVPIKVYRGLEDPGPSDTNYYKIKIYSGDDRPEGDPSKEWHLFNCILFTSVIEAGNSFTLEEHFKKTYGIFTPRSFGPQSSAQMILRSRTTKDILIYVQPGGVSKYPDYVRTPGDIRKYLAQEMLAGRMDTPEGIKMSYVEGVIDFAHPYTDMYVDVEYREMIGKRYYLPKLLQLLKSQGIKFGSEINVDNYINRLQIHEEAFKEISMDIKSEIRTIKDTKRWNECVSVSERTEITHVEAGVLLAKTVRTKEEDEMLEKYEMKMRYNLETITPSDVSTYRDRRVKESYNNVLLCQELSGVMDEATKIEKMTEIAHIMEAIEYPVVDRALQERMEYIPPDDNQSMEMQQELQLCTQQYLLKLNKTIENLSTREQLELQSLLREREDSIRIKENIQQLQDSLKGVSPNVIERALEIRDKTRISEAIKPIGRQEKPHIVSRIVQTRRMKKYKKNMHTINILRMYGFNEWLRTPEYVNNNNMNGASSSSLLQYRVPRITAPEFKRKTKDVYDYMKLHEDTFDKLPVVDFAYDETSLVRLTSNPDKDVKVMLDENEKKIGDLRKYINKFLMGFYVQILKCGKGDSCDYYLKQNWEKDADGIIRLIK